MISSNSTVRGHTDQKSLVPLLFNPLLKIKLFDSYGRFVGTRDQSTIEALYARELVTLERNGKGRIIAAHEREVHLAAPPADPKKRAAFGFAHTRYSYEERPEVLWDLKRLHGARDGSTYAPGWLWPVFARVLIECLV